MYVVDQSIEIRCLVLLVPNAFWNIVYISDNEF